MSEPTPAIEVETGTVPQAAVIWLHGLGADGSDFVPLLEVMDTSGLPATRFVFPHAPFRPVTINGGMVMRAWYDILGADFGAAREDELGVRASAAALESLVERENARGIAPGRIVLAGFSQGGVIALHAGLRHPRRLAGILALSTYCALPAALPQEASAANRDVPVFMAHGRFDPVIPFDFARASRDRLLGLGYEVDWREYEMDHTVALEEIGAIGDWLQRVLARPAS